MTRSIADVRGEMLAAVARMRADPGGRFRRMHPLEHANYIEFYDRCLTVLLPTEKALADQFLTDEMAPALEDWPFTTVHDEPRQGRIDWYELWDRALLVFGRSVAAAAAPQPVRFPRDRSADRSPTRSAPPIIRPKKQLPPLEEARATQRKRILRAARFWLVATLAEPHLLAEPRPDLWPLRRAWHTAWIPPGGFDFLAPSQRRKV